MLLGVDYYPEQWERLMADGDLDRIKELGCNVIRIGEFAWHRMESKEGEYDFSFFDEIIDKARARELKVIFGTPTATPPPWLIHKHPDILQVDDRGINRVYGGRHTFCFSSAIYIEYCKKIVSRLAAHYKNETNIIAWQVDNELGHEGSDVCWCEKCVTGFRARLKEKYGDIAKLNEVYGTVYGSAIGTDGDGIGKTQSGTDETTVLHTDGETGEKPFDGESVDVADGKTVKYRSVCKIYRL